MKKLKDIYSSPEKKVVTAHRGFSGKYPENTLLAFQKAMDIGVDIVEFDIRQTADGEIIVIHDPSVDRVSDGSGLVEELTFADIRKLNVSYWSGPHDTGRRLDQPLIEGIQIPTFEEALSLMADKIAMNIQVYLSGKDAIVRAIKMFDEFDLYEKSFFMVGTFEVAEFFKNQNSHVDLCVGEDRADIERHSRFGLKLVQPSRKIMSPELCEKIRQLGLWANMFYSNNQEDNKKYLEMGIQGIISDNPDMLLKSIDE